MRHAWLFVEHDDDVAYSKVRLERDVMKLTVLSIDWSKQYA